MLNWKFTFHIPSNLKTTLLGSGGTPDPIFSDKETKLTDLLKPNDLRVNPGLPNHSYHSQLFSNHVSSLSPIINKKVVCGGSGSVQVEHATWWQMGTVTTEAKIKCPFLPQTPILTVIWLPVYKVRGCWGEELTL